MRAIPTLGSVVMSEFRQQASSKQPWLNINSASSTTSTFGCIREYRTIGRRTYHNYGGASYWYGRQ
jgi:hypothetical protein